MYEVASFLSSISHEKIALKLNIFYFCSSYWTCNFKNVIQKASDLYFLQIGTCSQLGWCRLEFYALQQDPMLDSHLSSAFVSQLAEYLKQNLWYSISISLRSQNIIALNLKEFWILWILGICIWPFFPVSRTILLSVISLLNEPNTFSPANVDASVMFRKWRDSKGKDKEYAEIIR